MALVAVHMAFGQSLTQSLDARLALIDSFQQAVERLYPLEVLHAQEWRELCANYRRWEEDNARRQTMVPFGSRLPYNEAKRLCWNVSLGRIPDCAPYSVPADTWAVDWRQDTHSIGQLRIMGKTPSTEALMDRLDSAFNQLESTRGLVLDLRFWYDADVRTATQVAGRFVSQRFDGLTVHKRVAGSRQNEDRTYDVVPSGPHPYPKPVIIFHTLRWPATGLIELLKHRDYTSEAVGSGGSISSSQGIRAALILDAAVTLEPERVQWGDSTCARIPTALVLKPGGGDYVMTKQTVIGAGCVIPSPEEIEQQHQKEMEAVKAELAAIVEKFEQAKP